MMKTSWVMYAFGAAFFAALTAVFGKLGVSGLNSNLATLIRTVVVLALLTAMVAMRGDWQRPSTIPAHSWLFLLLSGAATGLSWLCYYRALQIGPVSGVAAVDKLSVALAITLGVLFLGEHLSWQLLLGAALITAGTLVIATL